MKERLTKQGVRDLDLLPSPKRERFSDKEPGPLRQCAHRSMRVDGYLRRAFLGYPRGVPWGHMECEECGLFLHSFDP